MSEIQALCLFMHLPMYHPQSVRNSRHAVTQSGRSIVGRACYRQIRCYMLLLLLLLNVFVVIVFVFFSDIVTVKETRLDTRQSSRGQLGRSNNTKTARNSKM